VTQLRETDGRFGGSDGASKAASKADVARDKAKAADEKTKPLEAEAAKYDHAHKKAMAEIAELRTKAEKADSKSDAKMVEDDKAEERYEVAKEAHEEDPDNKQASDAHERALEEHLEARKLANQAVARANSLGRRLAHETELIEEDEDKRNHIYFAAVRARERATYAHEKALSAEQKRDDFKEYHAIFEKPWAERGPLLVERAERAERERVAAHLAEREAEEKDREATKRALKTQEPKDWEAAGKTDREVISALNSKERAEESAERWGRMRDHAPKTTRKSGKREASTMDDRRYALRTGEPMAIGAGSIRRDADGFFVLLGGPPPENELRGTVAIVNVRGALQHWSSPFGDSYEGITARVGSAIATDPKPTTIALRIDSPGGLVSGLNECARRIQAMCREAGIPLVALVDELAASAAYALCCACSRVYAPPSAVVGSVGVISTMVSIAARDEKDGIAFRVITSGKRKADGHLHVPITEDAVRAETRRNEQLAEQFFALASKARGMPASRIDALQAGIFLGHDAKAAGLVDEVGSLDAVLAKLGGAEVEMLGAGPAPNAGNITDRRAREARADAARLTRR
jgi:ClpP class serine protease